MRIVLAVDMGDRLWLNIKVVEGGVALSLIIVDLGVKMVLDWLAYGSFNVTLEFKVEDRGFWNVL